MQAELESTIHITPWGKHAEKEVFLFQITNSSGSYVRLSNYGATIVGIGVPDRSAHIEDVVLGYDGLQDYLNDRFYMGSTIGRFANRVGNATFSLDGVAFELEKNDGQNSNHGGWSGYHQRVFDYEIAGNSVRMTIMDEDGAGGFPGKINFGVTFTWNAKNELCISYEAETTKPTIANFTSHSYLNLSGKDSLITEHYLSVDSGLHLESDGAFLPTGKILLDKNRLISGRRLGDIIDAARPMETGLNDYFLLSKQNEAVPRALLYEQESGRELQIFTSYPGVMVYSGQYLSTSPGRDGYPYKPLNGICLECQHYPDSVRHGHFPKAVLRPGQHYREFIKFLFKVNK
jgi:aldose 1-epimerase